MNLSDIVERFKDAIQTYWGQFQESSLYITVKEKYDDLSPSLQKLVQIASALALLFALIMPPYSFFSSSFEYEATFEDTKSVVKDLLRLKRDLAQSPNVQMGPPPAQLKAQVDEAVRSLGLTEEQIKGVEEVAIQSDKDSSLIAPAITQQGVQLTVWKLNLTQFTELSYKIQRLHPMAKLVSLDMKANSDDNHYYDAIYQVVSFSVPIAQMQEEPEEPSKNTKGKRN